MTIIESLASDCADISGSVTSDKHLQKLKHFLRQKNMSTQKNKIISSVVKTEDNVCRKNFDVVWESPRGRHAIELKSINGSAAKNLNNRIEEMVGQSFIAKEVYGLQTFSYIFVDNCSLKHKAKERLLVHAKKAIKSGYLDKISIFQTHNSCFYKTKSFQHWNFS